MNTMLYSLEVIIFMVWNLKWVMVNVVVKILKYIFKDIIMNKNAIVTMIIVSLIGSDTFPFYIIIFSWKLVQIVWKRVISGLIVRVKNRWVQFLVACHNHMGQRFIFLSGKGSHFEVS